jgi:hypothetical protein
MRRAFVHVRTAVNAAAIRREERAGRKVIIVPSATMPDDIVMNGILYPGDETRRACNGLERKPAPVGHPQDAEGNYISASDPEAHVRYGIGAWNENVRHEGGRVLVDKVIDEEHAGLTEKGRRVLAALDAGGPIHTSTGLLCDLGPPRGDDHEHVAANIDFDHDAILIDEEGAATPEQGVGMLVNGEKIMVLNATIKPDTLEAREPQLARILNAVRRAWPGAQTAKANQDKETDPMDEEEKKALEEKVANLEKELEAAKAAKNAEGEDEDEEPKGNTEGEEDKEKMNAEPGTIEATLAAIMARLDALEADKAAAVNNERDGLIQRVVRAGVLREAEAKGMQINALRSLAARLGGGVAAPAVGRFVPNAAEEDEFAGYDLNAIEEKE